MQTRNNKKRRVLVKKGVAWLPWAMLGTMVAMIIATVYILTVFAQYATTKEFLHEYSQVSDVLSLSHRFVNCYSDRKIYGLLLEKKLNKKDEIGKECFKGHDTPMKFTIKFLTTNKEETIYEYKSGLLNKEYMMFVPISLDSGEVVQGTLSTQTLEWKS